MITASTRFSGMAPYARESSEPSPSPSTQHVPRGETAGRLDEGCPA